MIKMVVFDLDGTLVNTLGGIAGACNHVLEAHGYETKAIDEYMSYVGNGLAMTMFSALPDTKKEEMLLTTETSSNTLLDASQLIGEPDFNHPELKGLVNELLDFYKLNPTIDSLLYEGVEEVLSYLDDHQIQWGIHTNKTASIAKDVADAFIDPTRYLGLKGPNEEVPKKPNPKGSLDLIEVAHEVSVDEVIYIGDTEVDIATAKKLGVPMISVSYGFRNKEFLQNLNPDYLVDTPLEIIGILKNLID